MSGPEREIPEGTEDGFGDEVEQAMRALNRRNRRGHTVIDYRLLAGLLGFPEGTEITGLFVDHRIEGLIVSIVSDDLPEVDEAVESTRVDFVGAVRLLPAAPPSDDEPLVMADPESTDVMYARIEMRFPDKENTTA